MDSRSDEKSFSQNIEELKEKAIQDNITKWQAPTSPLAPLSEEELDIVYQISDLIKEEYYETTKSETLIEELANEDKDMFIYSNTDFIKKLVNVENEIKLEALKELFPSCDKIEELSSHFQGLLEDTEFAIKSLQELENQYNEVLLRTCSLHNVSEQLTKNQRILIENKKSLKERLHYFTYFDKLSDDLNNFTEQISTEQFIENLNSIHSALEYLHKHINYKESKIYIAKYENLLSKSIILIRSFVSNVIISVTKEVTDPDNKIDLLALNNSQSDSVISLYYGKYQSAAMKIKTILKYIEEKAETYESYSQLITDCQQIYFSQRSFILAAVAKALNELKIKHKKDHSMLFRSSGLFVMQMCQDEAASFNLFFSKESQQLRNYLASICQNLYDSLRPSLIGINHLEILTELCNILRNEHLSDYVLNNEYLDKFVETIRQLLQDVEERLIFRTNVFFQHDLSSYKPSPGDLAYPEKLEQMENIAEEVSEGRTLSRMSSVSVESQEVATINAAHLGQFRSYTGNSPADLHGMWYPTVKRTLVCLSRLYFSLDRETFQGLAQEALVVCVKTIDDAGTQIAARKGTIDGKLFQIKHLLILREQIAPFQADFTIKEVALDFSNIKTAAVGLIQKRNRLFSFSSNNALLEFLLEGTPKVKEYLVDSRKEIDKHLKASCEAFISFCVQLLVGNLTNWIQKADQILSKTTENVVPLREQEFGKPQALAGLINTSQRNIKTKIPDIQRSMQLYLANKETEFILLKPIKNNLINVFIQLHQTLTKAKYTQEDLLVIACPSPEQVNVLVCSVSLTLEQDSHFSTEDKSN
ncbi:conserved oligomeric Golgi complex subunit 3 isoform X2 [Agrilus planipennis]|nr:conserved oligomeric Golgi complex subunit 3 isoform X2 [Agrilus planipennis]